MPEVILAVVGGAVVAAALAAVIVPSRVRYTERVAVAMPPAEVYDRIRRQEDLMAWSAWPAATNSTCRVDGPDGEVGARTVFISNGKEAGYQEVTELVPGRRVVLTLSDPSPFRQQPVVTFEVSPAAGGAGTDVALVFENRIPRPFNVIAFALGLPRFTRRLHVKDLKGLKSYCERRPAA